MRTTPAVFVAVIVALLALGLFVANDAYAGQVSLLSTFAVDGVSVVPVGHGHGGGHAGWHGGGNHVYYGGGGHRRHYRGGFFYSNSMYAGCTCVWTGYRYKCYNCWD